MLVFAAKLMDHVKSPMPYNSDNCDIVASYDRWALWDVRNYDNVYRGAKFIEIPSVMNKVRESKIWYGK
jgi:hypothetical protein